MDRRPVKPRRYDSTRRLEQAAATRRRILEAARGLFEARGFTGTTVAAIAAEAGVAVKTVYIAFATKSGVLRALWNTLLRGDEGGAPVAERAWYREVLDEPDPARALDLNARNSRAVKERAGAVMEVIRAAAPADADTAALWSRIQTEFHANQRAVVDALAGRGALRAGLGADRATDVLWTLNHPDVWRLLVVERGWTPAEYELWLGGATRRELLDGG